MKSKAQLARDAIFKWLLSEPCKTLFDFRLFGEETKDKLPNAEFLTAVGTLKFRGTSILFRLSQSCVAQLKRYDSFYFLIFIT